jgi:hypothetical protein
VPRKKRTIRPRITHVEARGQLRDEPDWDKFAWALLQHVKALRERSEQSQKTKPETKK